MPTKLWNVSYVNFNRRGKAYAILDISREHTMLEAVVVEIESRLPLGTDGFTFVGKAITAGQERVPCTVAVFPGADELVLGLMTLPDNFR